ncbi:MAG TPA: hypothetical protein VHL54_10960, partial [Actinomycetota bacterium]|nr:hypothetical protein [Actinomycetota bacterium]
SFTFKIEVTNPGTEDLVLTELVDDVYGNLNGRGTCATGGTIEPGETYACEFTVEFTGNGGASQTDTVTATGEDDEGNQVEDIDDAVIRLVAPPVSPTVSPPPTLRPAPPAPPAPPRPQAPSVLSRTGGALLPFLALALALIAGGMVLRSSGPAFDAGRPAGRPRRRADRRR